MKKRFSILILSLAASSAHALTISNVSYTPPTISNETNSPNGTTISFTIDTPGLVTINIARVQNVGDTGTQVATLSQTFATTTNTSIAWNGLWLINGAQGRINGNYSFSLTLSTSGASTTITAPSVLVINSVDIHSLTYAPSFDTNHSATFPYTITYALAKDANVTTTIANSSNSVVRTLINNKLQLNETLSSNTLTWDGLGDDGKAVPIGVYTLAVNAVNPTTGDHANQQTLQIPVQSLAGSASDPQKLFEDNVFVYPNPVRNGQGTFQIEAVRDGANLSLKIYTIAGDLVLDRTFPNVPAGNIQTFPWNVTNQSGNKVGRGLYYYVVRENDSQGTLQTVKKMAVLP